MDEKDLVALSKSGDKDAFAKLYSLYRDKLYRYAYYRLENTHDAEDAVSDAVCAAFYNIKSLKNNGAFSAWLFKILHRSCGEIIKRREKTRQDSDIDEMEGKLSYGFENVSQRSELTQALDILKEEDKEIVLLSVVCQMKSAEIARIFGIGAGTVRSRLSRSLKKMRNFLEE